MIKLDEVKMPVEFCHLDLIEKVQQILKVSAGDICSVEIYKMSIDARKKPNVMYVLSLAVCLKGNLENKFADKKFEWDRTGLNYEKINSSTRPIIVGFGPAGMFCGLALAKMGLKPIIVEQGNDVDQRQKDVNEFWEKGKLNVHSNVQFGEGGAGTFSDGKLNTNLNNAYCKKVINEFILHGAPKEIGYINKPHIGSDKLSSVVKNIRQEIITLGGEVRFATKLVNILVDKNNVSGVETVNVLSEKREIINTNNLVLAVGHSARDVYSLLFDMNVELKQKPFAMGVRIQQSQDLINKSQYGQNYNKKLPPADYKLVSHLDNGRSVFTFCMCPGGQVVASSSENGEIVTNGMSNFDRSGKFANSAVLVNVTQSDYSSSHPLAGVWFQQKYERLAYSLGGGDFKAPYTTCGQFLNGKSSKELDSTYKPNLTKADISKCLPEFVTSSLKQGLKDFDKKIKGFSSDENLLIAVESRSSSPLTIVRDESYQSSILGIYPCGEGAGYAGGIISSAQDGIKVAEKIYQKLLQKNNSLG